MIRAFAKRLPHPLLMRLHHRYQLVRQSALARELSRRTGLPLLESLDLSKLKTSDTVFVLGSGSSINEISDERWRIIGRHDSIAMNFWPAHRFVPRIHLFENILASQRSAFGAFQGLMRRRADDYQNAVKIASELQPLAVPQLILEIPEKFRRNLYIGYSSCVVARTEPELVSGIRYLRGKGVFDPGEHISWHFKYQGSVTAAITLAARMNYRRIILCGVDLGNAEYFYQDPERYPEASGWEFAPRGQSHLMARRYAWGLPSQLVIECLKREILDPSGIELFVENRSSTLFPRVPEVRPQLFEELAEANASAHL